MFCCSMGLACNEQQLNVVQSYSMARNAEIIVGCCWPLYSHMLICNCRQLSFCPEKSGPSAMEGYILCKKMAKKVKKLHFTHGLTSHKGVLSLLSPANLF